MDFFDVVRTRRSVRSFKPDMVSDEVLNVVLEAVRIAPSGSNRQPWRFIIVKDEITKQRLIRACGDQKWLAEAPIIVVACGHIFDYNRGGYMEDFSMLVDLSIAMTHLILAARNEGLGTCWIGFFNNAQVKRVLEVPEGWNVAGLTPLGYPEAGEKAFTEPGPRKPLSEIVSTDKF
jgi:nitroreductase